MLEVVEDGELVPGHDVGVGLGLDLAPELGEGALEDLADGGIVGAIRALAGNLEGLGDGGIVLLRSHDGLGVRLLDAMRHGEGCAGAGEDSLVVGVEVLCLRCDDGQHVGEGRRRRRASLLQDIYVGLGRSVCLLLCDLIQGRRRWIVRMSDAACVGGRKGFWIYCLVADDKGGCSPLRSSCGARPGPGIGQDDVLQGPGPN